MLRTKWICLVCLALLGGFPSGSRAKCCVVAGRPARQSTEIPFEIYKDNLVVVRGTIGSMENVKVLLDTGSGVTIVGSTVATKLNLRANAQLDLMTLGDRVNVRSALLPQISIGAWQLSSATVVVQDLSDLQRRLGFSIEAVAGLDVLSTRSFMIDYRKRKLIFSPSEIPKKFVRFEPKTQFPTVKAKIAGYELRLIVDSGAPGLLLFRDRLRARLAKLKPVTSGNAQMITPGGTIYGTSMRVSEVLLGAETIGPQVLLVVENGPDIDRQWDGLLGFTMTGFQKVWLDFENGLLGWS